MRADGSGPRAAGWAVVAILAFGACRRAPSLQEAPAPPAQAAGSVAFESADKLRALGYVQAGMVVAAPPKATSGAAPGALAAVTAARKLIRTGKLGLEVPAYDAAAAAVARIAESEGGYVAGSQATSAGVGRARGSVTVRVPAERFPAALAALKGLGKVESEGVGTEDVTKAYADLETRLRVKRETEARLRDLLKHRAAKLEEILEVERELSRVIEDIEQAEGERRYYDQQVALSTIVIELWEPEAGGRTTFWTPLTTALGEAMSILAESTAAIVVVFMAILPWAIVALLVYSVVRRVRRRRAASRKGNPPPEVPSAPAAGVGGRVE